MTITHGHRPPLHQPTSIHIDRQRDADTIAPTPPTVPAHVDAGVASPCLTVDPGAAEQRIDGRLLVQAGDVRVQHLQATLSAPGDAPADASIVAAGGARGPKLRPGYESLETLSRVLPGKDARFDPSSPKGRATLALALAIGGTEVYGRGTKGTDFFTRRGGTGNQMLGFAQFNLAYHRATTQTPARYSKLLADMLTGAKALPNSKTRGDFASGLLRAVESGRVKNGSDLQSWMRSQGLGGSNWQGIDDGWHRNPGLGDDLVRFLQETSRSARAANV